MTVDKLMLITNPFTAGHLKTGSLLRLLPRRIVDGLEAVSQNLPVSICDRVMIQLGGPIEKGLEWSLE